MLAQQVLPNYSQVAPAVLDRKSRLVIARQIQRVIEVHWGKQRLNKAHLLDIGCSAGIITAQLAGLVREAQGIDLDTHALKLAKKWFRRPNLSFKLMDAGRMTFLDNSFDLIICHQVYYYLDRPQALFREIYRVLSPGGICLFVGLNRYRLWENDYHLPLLPLFPPPLADLYLRLSGHQPALRYHYLSFWELKAICQHFIIHRYTPKILHTPGYYHFTSLVRFQGILRRIPLGWWKVLEPLIPNFIWILEKPHDFTSSYQ